MEKVGKMRSCVGEMMGVGEIIGVGEMTGACCNALFGKVMRFGIGDEIGNALVET